MGWMEPHERFRDLKQVRKYFQSDVSKDWELVTDSMKLGCWYGAVRKKTTGETICFVTKYSFSASSGKLCYKDMSEMDGPNECHPTKKILKLLTPISNQYANDWRAKCLQQFKKGI